MGFCKSESNSGRYTPGILKVLLPPRQSRGISPFGIGSQFYERLALSQNKAAMLEKEGGVADDDEVTPEEAIKDPFVLEFLALKDEYSESDLEEALILNLTDFLLEPGGDFASTIPGSGFCARRMWAVARKNWIAGADLKVVCYRAFIAQM